MKKIIALSIFFYSLISLGQSQIPKFDSRGNLMKEKEVDSWQDLKTNSKISPNKLIYKKISQSNSISHRDSSYYWEWDTVTNNWITQPYGKTVNYIYNTNNYIISSLYRSWNGITWVDNSMQYENYDSNGNYLGNYTQFWNGTMWINSTRETYTYDSHNNELSYLSENGSGTNWINNEKRVSTFDANDNMSSNTNLTWNGNSWDSTFQGIYTYNSNNKVIQDLSKDWHGNFWRTINTYDSNNDQIFSLSESWNGSSWDTTYTTTNTYDNNHNCIFQITRNWYFGYPVDDSRSSWTYTNNKETYHLTERWDQNNMIWINQNQSFYTYGMNSLFSTNTLMQNWVNNSWQTSYKYDYTYDSDHIYSLVTFQSWGTNGGIITRKDSIYHYFSGLTAIQNLNTYDPILSIFPNPSNNILFINTTGDYESICLKNAFGQTVKTIKKTNNENSLYINDISAGIYFIELLDKKGATLRTKKFIKN